MTDAGGSVAETTDYSPLGVPTTPLSRTPYHFTGEIRDGVGLQYHRARHYAPALGTWTALDPFEGVTGRPMSLNGYLYVEGNTPNATDPSGMFAELGLFDDSIDSNDILYSSICLNKNQQTTPIPPSLGSSNLTDSTVMIALGECAKDNNAGVPPANVSQDVWEDIYGGGADYTGPINASGNLGTLTPRGIITHDHYGSWNETGFSSASGPSDAVNRLKEWPCIHITGSNGRVSITGDQIQAQPGNTNTIIISLSQTVDGQPKSLTTIGQPARENKNYRPRRGDALQFARVAGPNARDELGNVGRLLAYFHHNLLETVTVRQNWARYTNRLLDRQAYATQWTPLSQLPRGEDFETGDSGGGVFYEGALVGVFLGRTRRDRRGITEGEYYYHRLPS